MPHVMGRGLVARGANTVGVSTWTSPHSCARVAAVVARVRATVAKWTRLRGTTEVGKSRQGPLSTGLGTRLVASTKPLMTRR
eukprot:1679170-Amphidinium_carterae.1